MRRFSAVRMRAGSRDSSVPAASIPISPTHARANTNRSGEADSSTLRAAECTPCGGLVPSRRPGATLASRGTECCSEGRSEPPSLRPAYGARERCAPRPSGTRNDRSRLGWQAGRNAVEGSKNRLHRSDPSVEKGRRRATGRASSGRARNEVKCAMEPGAGEVSAGQAAQAGPLSARESAHERSPASERTGHAALLSAEAIQSREAGAGERRLTRLACRQLRRSGASNPR
jgi:hypothetical protein